MGQCGFEPDRLEAPHELEDGPAGVAMLGGLVHAVLRGKPGDDVLRQPEGRHAGPDLLGRRTGPPQVVPQRRPDPVVLRDDLVETVGDGRHQHSAMVGTPGSGNGSTPNCRPTVTPQRRLRLGATDADGPSTFI